MAKAHVNLILALFLPLALLHCIAAEEANNHTEVVSMQECPTELSNDGICGQLLLNVNASCDCYSFCDDDLLICANISQPEGFYDENLEECSGALYGCTDKQRTNVEQERVCAAPQNADDETCARLLADETANCDCYSYCDGVLIGCDDFGERENFDCNDGNIVVGCTIEQKQTVNGYPSSATIRFMSELQVALFCFGALVAGIMLIFA